MKYGLMQIVIQHLPPCKPLATSRASIIEDSLVSQGDLYVTAASAVGAEIKEHIDNQGIEYIMERVFPAWHDELRKLFGSPADDKTWSEHTIVVAVYPAKNDNEVDAYEFAGEIDHFQRMVRKELNRKRKAAEGIPA